MKALVLNSGGMDSSTLVGMAVDRYGKENVITASLIYGQRHVREIECAKKIADYYGVRHIEEDISVIMKYAGSVCSLMADSDEAIPEGTYSDQQKASGSARVSSYVPFRNGVMLSVAAAYADSLFPNEKCEIWYGAHSDDAAGNAYADCTEAFASAMDTAINLGTYGNIRVIRPLINMSKADVCKEGLRLKVPFELTTSCYNGREKACGCCGTCYDRIEAFRANRVIDPIAYEQEVNWAGCTPIQQEVKRCTN